MSARGLATDASTDCRDVLFHIDDSRLGNARSWLGMVASLTSYNLVDLGGFVIVVNYENNTVDNTFRCVKYCLRKTVSLANPYHYRLDFPSIFLGAFNHHQVVEVIATTHGDNL
ncbi:hypothetical protein DIRU0_D17722 [Diutina rugosa]